MNTRNVFRLEVFRLYKVFRVQCKKPAMSLLRFISPNNPHPPERYSCLLPNFLYFLITCNNIIINLIEEGCMHVCQENCYDFLLFFRNF